MFGTILAVSFVCDLVCLAIGHVPFLPAISHDMLVANFISSAFFGFAYLTFGRCRP